MNSLRGKVNGQPITLTENVHEPILTAMRHALNKSGNSGQPLENWELRDANGQIMTRSMTTTVVLKN